MQIHHGSPLTAREKHFEEREHHLWTNKYWSRAATTQRGLISGNPLIHPTQRLADIRSSNPLWLATRMNLVNPAPEGTNGAPHVVAVRERPPAFKPSRRDAPSKGVVQVRSARLAGARPREVITLTLTNSNTNTYAYPNLNP